MKLAQGTLESPLGALYYVHTAQDTMLKRLPNGTLLHLPGQLDPDSARKRMEAEERWMREHREELEVSSQQLFDDMFGG